MCMKHDRNRDNSISERIGHAAHARAQMDVIEQVSGLLRCSAPTRAQMQAVKQAVLQNGLPEEDCLAVYRRISKKISHQFEKLNWLSSAASGRCFLPALPEDDTRKSLHC